MTAASPTSAWCRNARSPRPPTDLSLPRTMPNPPVVAASLALLGAASSAAAQAARPAAPPQEYRIDAGHSRVEFSVPFVYLPVRGRFNQLRGTLRYDPAAPERSSVTAVIDA